MRKRANRLPGILLGVAAIAVCALAAVGCGGSASGDQAQATTDSAFTDEPIGQLIDMTVHRLSKAIDFMRLTGQEIRVTGQVASVSGGADPSGWKVSIVDPANPSAGSVTVDIADSGFASLVDAQGGLQAGDSITVEGEFTGVDADQNAAITAQNILFGSDNFHRGQ